MKRGHNADSDRENGILPHLHKALAMEAQHMVRLMENPVKLHYSSINPRLQRRVKRSLSSVQSPKNTYHIIVILQQCLTLSYFFQNALNTTLRIRSHSCQKYWEHLPINTGWCTCIPRCTALPAAQIHGCFQLTQNSIWISWQFHLAFGGKLRSARIISKRHSLLKKKALNYSCCALISTKIDW